MLNEERVRMMFPSIRTKDMRMTQRSVDAVYPTSAAGLYPQFTVQGS